jgi:hypothetical protein
MGTFLGLLQKPFEPQRTQRITGETSAFIRVHPWLKDLLQ